MAAASRVGVASPKAGDVTPFLQEAATQFELASLQALQVRQYRGDLGPLAILHVGAYTCILYRAQCGWKMGSVFPIQGDRELLARS